MLGLNDEALVQYDELDALFSQFVANFTTCDNLKWLCHFQYPLEKWHGLKLANCQLDDHPSLLELRAYIFARQAQMLLHTNKVWEVVYSLIDCLVKLIVLTLIDGFKVSALSAYMR